jgi:hypothetical protein
VSNELWPEVQYHHWFDDRTRAIAMTAVSRDLASQASYQAEEGLTFEHRFTNFFLGRIGYGPAAFDAEALVEQRAVEALDDAVRLWPAHLGLAVFDAFETASLNAA